MSHPRVLSHVSGRPGTQSPDVGGGCLGWGRAEPFHRDPLPSPVGDWEQLLSLRRRTSGRNRDFL